jgi:hypothetical protein
MIIPNLKEFQNFGKQTRKLLLNFMQVGFMGFYAGVFHAGGFYAGGFYARGFHSRAEL